MDSSDPFWHHMVHASLTFLLVLFCSTRAWKAVPEFLTHIPANNIQIRVPFYVQFFYSLALEFPVKTQFLSYLGQLIFYSSPSVKFPHILVIHLNSFVTVHILL